MEEWQKRLSRKFLAYRLLANLWFVGATWLYFYRLFITDQQVGLLDGMAFAIGLIVEIPSGALADKIGHDRAVRLGQTMAGVGYLIQAIGINFVPLFVGQTILMIGFALTSGADEALFFENFKFKKGSTKWRKLVTRGEQAALIGTLVATAVGGLIYTVSPHLTWVLNGLAFLLAAVIVWPVKDVRERLERQKVKLGVELRSYFSNIAVGLKQFRLPSLSVYVPLILTVQALFYTVGMGMLRLILLDRFGFSPLSGSIVVASCGVVTVGVLAYMHRHADKFSEKRVLTVISLVAVAGLLLSIANIGLWGYAVILAFYAGEHALYPFMSEILNYHAPDSQRSTVLSVASFFKQIPYVVLAPIIGFLSTNGQLDYFFVIWSGVILVALVTYLSVKKRDSKIKPEI
jgi:MFS family permease